MALRQRYAVKHTVSSIVDRNVFDLSSGAIVDSADARQDVIPNELIEELAVEDQMLRCLYVDQCIIDDEIAIRTADQL